MLEVEVHDIKGTCPVYKKGDKIKIKNPNIVLGCSGRQVNNGQAAVTKTHVPFLMNPDPFIVRTPMGL